MVSYQVKEFGKPLVRVEIETPPPEGSQVLVPVEAAESVQKLGRLRRRAACASGSGAGFVWSRLIGLATLGASHAVDHRSKVGRRRH
jgi:hypothetical protein